MDFLERSSSNPTKLNFLLVHKTCVITVIYNKLPFFFGLQVLVKTLSLFGSTAVNGPDCDAFYPPDVVHP